MPLWDVGWVDDAGDPDLEESRDGLRVKTGNSLDGFYGDNGFL